MIFYMKYFDQYKSLKTPDLKIEIKKNIEELMFFFSIAVLIIKMNKTIKQSGSPKFFLFNNILY